MLLSRFGLAAILIGLDYIYCKSCTTNSDCDTSDICLDDLCASACTGRNCTSVEHGECYGVEHQAKCRCGAGYEGNARRGCHLKVVRNTSCSQDVECGATDKCVNGECVNACNFKSCSSDPNSECVVVHLSKCQCNDGFVQGKTGCVPKGKKCSRHDDCGPTELCSADGVCVDGCTGKDCGDPNAECVVKIHEPWCHCRAGFKITPDGCKKDDTPAERKCLSDMECAMKERCKNGACADACRGMSCNDPNSACFTMMHESMCKCNPGYTRMGDRCQASPPAKVDKYMLGFGWTDWYTAYRYCVSQNRTLPIIRNRAEDENLYNAMARFRIRTSWIGNLMVKERLHVITGEAVSYSNLAVVTRERAPLRTDIVGCLLTTITRGVFSTCWTTHNCFTCNPFICVWYD